jgi:hypothetical protein
MVPNLRELQKLKSRNNYELLNGQIWTLFSEKFILVIGFLFFS